MNTPTFETFNIQHGYTLLILCAVCLVGLFDFFVMWQLSDVLDYVLVSPYTTKHDDIFFIALLATGYAGRPVGGILLGRHADKKGRKSALWISMLGVAIFSIILGILPTYKTVGDFALTLFFLTRLAQGLFFGGVYPLSFIYVIESLPIRHIGIGCGILVGAGMLGMNILSFVLYLLENTLTLDEMHQFGFRLPILAGGVIAFLLLFLIHKMPAIHKPAQMLDNINKAKSTLKHWQLRLIVFVLCLGFASIFMVNIILLMDLASLAFFVPSATLTYGVSLAVIFCMLGSVFFGYLTDVINVSKVLIVGLILLTISFTLLILNLKNGGDLALLYFVLMGFFAGTMGAIAPAMTRLLPIFGRAINFTTLYNLAFSLVGIAVPFLLGYLTFYSGFAPLIYMGLVIIFLLFCSFYLYYEPRNTNLDE